MTLIAISSITVPAGRRRLDPDWVETLSDLFASQGQMTPIEVIASDDNAYRLIFGGHRLAAAKQLGWTEIDAQVRDAASIATIADQVLREITENFARRDLSVLDRAVDIARWREAYDAAHVVSKGGRTKKGATPEELTAKFAVSFSTAAQKVFGISERSIFNAVKVASIQAEVRFRIALHAVADNQSELLLLAAESSDRQEKIAGLLTSEPPSAASVTEAIAVLDRTPKSAKPARWEKLSGDFSRMKEADQDRFFELHADAIARWQKGRTR